MIITLNSETDFDGWRAGAREALAKGLSADSLAWVTPSDHPPLLPPVETVGAPNLRPTVPKDFVRAAKNVICHREPARFDRLTCLLFRLQDAPHLLADASDPDVKWMMEIDKAIRRDVHKMHAFVRFRKVGEREHQGEMREVFTAWFEPQHRIIRLGAPWFHRRFVGMDWTILTPDGCASWDGEELRYAPGVEQSAAPTEDVMEEAWQTYYASIFNPSRIKIGAMMSEMPKLYWKNLPEAQLIPSLLRSSEEKRRAMMEATPSLPNIRTEKVNPVTSTTLINNVAEVRAVTQLSDAAAMAAGCQLCDLYEPATQTVFGQGPEQASLMFVGEQPGDQEDVAGTPFIGPAGQLFDQCLNEAGIDRGDTYVTNAVKHFRYQMRGRRRIHERPQARHIKACSVWLETERALVRPDVIVCLGRTALRAVLGKATTLKSVRGDVLRVGGDDEHPPARVIGTVHPSYLLRVPDADIQRQARAEFLNDLRRARDLVAEIAA